MTQLKEFFNEVSKDNRIFTAEDIGEMPLNEFRNNEKAIFHQMANLGVPRRNQLAGNDDVIYVHAYTRADGTQVKAHYRSRHGHLTGAAANADNQTYSTSPLLKGRIEYNDVNIPKIDVKQLTNLLKNTWENIQQSAMNVLWETSSTPEEIADNPELTQQEKVLSGLSKLAKYKMPIAYANLQNAMNDFSEAEKNPHAHILNSRNEISNESLNNLMNKVNVPKNSRGIYYDNNSNESKQLWNSPEVQNYIVKNKEKLSNNHGKFVDKLEFEKRSDTDDNYYGIQNAKLLNPHITNDGFFDGLVVDYYDFEYRSKKNPSDYINNFGYSMQEKGKLENYFIIYHIHEKI